MIKVTVIEPAIWIESDMLGGHHVMAKIDGYDAEELASFYCSYAFTSSSITNAFAHRFAREIGALDPIAVKIRPFEIKE